MFSNTTIVALSAAIIVGIAFSATAATNAHRVTNAATEQDLSKRQTLLRLLAEEQAKLAALNDPPGDEKSKS